MRTAGAVYGAAGAGGSAPTCALTPTISQTGTANQHTHNYYDGQTVIQSGNKSLCKVVCNAILQYAGATKNCTLKVYALSGTSLGTLLGSSDVVTVPTGITSITFPFTSFVALTNGVEYALVLDSGGSDIRWGEKWNGTIPGTSRTWNSSFAQVANNTSYDRIMDIYYAV